MENTIILVNRGNAMKIAAAFEVSKSMVSKSLRGHRMGELSKKIRHVALTQYDGKEMQPVKSASKEV